MRMICISLVLGIPAVLALQSQVHVSKADFIANATRAAHPVRGLGSASRRIDSVIESPADTINKIVFIKLHNVGSSTMTGILHRHCEFYRKRCFVSPYVVEPGWLDIKTFSKEDLRQMLPVFQSAEVPALDIFPNHEVMATEELDALIPGNFKIAFFRSPFDRHMSGMRHRSDHFGASFILDIMENLQKNIKVDTCSFPQMSRQIQPDQVEALDYVMLTEEYDTSLMMLRMALGWSMFDMLYRKEFNGEHSAAVLNASDVFEEYLHQPAESLNEATRAYLELCAGQMEVLLYQRAATKFQNQWNLFTAEEQQQIHEDTATFVAAREELEACCETHPDDTYCLGMLEDNQDWTRRYQSQGYTYVSIRLNGDTVETPVTQESACMSAARVALHA
mmetsp:Transcript_33390/g.61255  ORF Transcript_33390/g.61255 Transcript_33390/m.61255 type:complete len:392 (-) Transcript_33390:43-1218(-)